MNPVSIELTQVSDIRKSPDYLSYKKRTGQKITVLTCYDFPTACLQDQVGIDVIYVADSVGTNVLGYESERDVTMADMIHHLKAVRRGAKNAPILVDLPYGSYDVLDQALENAKTLLSHGASGIKLEGGQEQQATVRLLTQAGIAVVGHIGFTPQTLREPGRKPRVQGRSFEQATALLESAITLEKAGAIAVVLELVPESLSKLITEQLTVPTIGVGAGRFCDGQVLVINDLLGITPFNLKLAKRYRDYHLSTHEAIKSFKYEVEQNLFPEQSHAFHMDEEIVASIAQWLDTANPRTSQ